MLGRNFFRLVLPVTGQVILTWKHERGALRLRRCSSLLQAKYQHGRQSPVYPQNEEL